MSDSANPNYLHLICSIIADKKSRVGVSRFAIVKDIETSYPHVFQSPAFKRSFRSAIKRGVDNGFLFTPTPSTYKNTEKAKKDLAAASKKASLAQQVAKKAPAKKATVTKKAAPVKKAAPTKAASIKAAPTKAAPKRSSSVAKKAAPKKAAKAVKPAKKVATKSKAAAAPKKKTVTKKAAPSKAKAKTTKSKSRR